MHSASKFHTLSEVKNIAHNHSLFRLHKYQWILFNAIFMHHILYTFGRLAHAMKRINCTDSITGRKKGEIFFLVEEQTTKNLHCTLLHSSFDLMSRVHGQVYNPTEST